MLTLNIASIHQPICHSPASYQSTSLRKTHAMHEPLKSFNSSPAFSNLFAKALDYVSPKSALSTLAALPAIILPLIPNVRNFLNVFPFAWFLIEGPLAIAGVTVPGYFARQAAKNARASRLRGSNIAMYRPTHPNV